jgi:hypothetical protein
MNGDTRPRDRLEAGIESLRAEVPVRLEWRARLLRELSTLPAPSTAETEPLPFPVRPRLVMAPVRALAAAIGFMLFGATAMYVVMSARSGGPAAVAASAPLGATGVPVQDSSLVTVRFMLVAPSAQRVALVGDFNRWSPDASPMRRARDGQSWIIEVGLNPGRHAYAFVVDDDVVADPTAPSAVGEDFGVPSSVVLVAEHSR